MISNVIDPFIGTDGVFLSPTEEVVNGIETGFGPMIKFAIAVLNIWSKVKMDSRREGSKMN